MSLESFDDGAARVPPEVTLREFLLFTVVALGIAGAVIVGLKVIENPEPLEWCPCEERVR